MTPVGGGGRVSAAMETGSREMFAGRGLPYGAEITNEIECVVLCSSIC